MKEIDKSFFQSRQGANPVLKFQRDDGQNAGVVLSKYNNYLIAENWMSEPKVLFEEHGNVAVIKINRPDKRNALDKRRFYRSMNALKKPKIKNIGQLY